MLCGDFNAVIYLSERARGVGSRRDTKLFEELIQDLDLVDLSLRGRSFT